MRRTLLLIATLIAQVSPSSFAQQSMPSQSPSPSPQTSRPQKSEAVDVVRITTNLVQVDAVVTDKNGKVVTDLKPEEVQIFEDGRQQKITHFSYYVAESPSAEKPTKPVTVDKNAPPVPPNRLRPEDIRRTIALVVDDLGLSFESTYYVRRALRSEEHTSELQSQSNLVCRLLLEKKKTLSI